MRPPFEQVISAYLYHMSEPADELWWLTAPGLVAPPPQVVPALRAAYGAAERPSCNLASAEPPSWMDVLKCLNTTEGLRAEGWHALSRFGGEVAGMTLTAEKLARAAAHQQTQQRRWSLDSVSLGGA